MKKINDVAELHSILLEIASEFHHICINHNIPYYMLGGTMLGAIRHHGFIPWDDDMDFGVPREYFSECVSILNTELPSHLKLITMDNCKSLSIDIVKISDSRTQISEIFKEGTSDDIGINIDIFPLDRLPKRGGNISKRIDRIVRVSKYVQLSASSRPLPNKIVAYLLKVLFFWTSHNTFRNLISGQLKNKGNFIGNVYGAWGDKETVKLQIFGTPQLYKFEEMEFMGVAQPHEYLTALYGNYMELPPENKRHLHIDNLCWK